MCNRHFYRCRDCLTVMAADEHLLSAECGICQGFVEYMGRVHRDRLVKEGLECPCDARCTSARGPSCNCKCGGKNHGSNLVVPVTRDAGKKPVLQARCTQVAIAIAEEWREAVATVLAAINSYKGQGWIPEHEFRVQLDMTRALNAARGKSVHKVRMKLLKPWLPAVEVMEVFALANDPPPHIPTQFDNQTASAQRKLISGLNCLPGQMELF
jgi:hypothetical protein